MKENEAVEIGLRAMNDCDPKEISNFLLREVFPQLRYKTIYQHFGRKLAIHAAKNNENISFVDAAKFIDEKIELWKIWDSK